MKLLKKHYGLRTFFAMGTFAQTVTTLGVALLLLFIIDRVSDLRIDLGDTAWILAVALAVSALLALFLNRRVFMPIRELNRAMNRVAQGDFKVQLEKRSRIRDIREMYDAFNLMTRGLDATETLQSDFVSNVSHEFKTPINAIEGYAMLLQGSPDITPEQSEYTERILHSTERLSTLVGNILLLSRVENRDIGMKTAAFRLDEQIRQSLLLLESAWAEKELDFDVELEEINYVGCEDLLMPVWSNLIGNAVKFSPRGGMIRLRLKKDESGRPVFRVEDQGPGIDPEAAAHIYEKFYQADSSHKQEGNGLGLALVKRILNLCGGEIGCENLPEGGCRFQVTLTEGRETA